MTDNEIIRALDFCCGNIINGEECTETMCYQVGLPEDRNGDTRWCRQWLIKDALDLINRKQAEIEMLKRCNWHISNDLREEINRNIRLQAEIEELLAEIERLKEQVNLWQEEAGSVGCANEWLKAYLKNAKAEAIKEFAEKVKEKAFPDDSICTQMVVEVSDIDDLAKEMVGESNV